MKNKKILFIVEENILAGRAYFGASNDLLLINSALKQGAKIYLTTPKEILQKNQFQEFSALKLSENLDQNKITDGIIKSWHKQVINCSLALPYGADDDELSSQILLNDAKMECINLKEVAVFNRAEPISLTNKFYDVLIGWQKNGVKILPNPYLNKILGDKLAIDAIHNNTKFYHTLTFLDQENQGFSRYKIPSKAIADIDLLAGVTFQYGENKISFESKIITLSKNNLTAEEIAQFYDLLIAGDFQKAEKIFSDEYQIFMDGVREYLAFHQKLNNDSIIKPAHYFGGIGVVVAQNKILNLNLAVQNIAQSFLAIKADCQKINHQNLAFLPAIIAQERATEAHLGDLRIVFCGDNLQGIFVRVNPDFEKSKANNLHFGGHPESLFKHYGINKEGIDEMIIDIKNSGKNSQLDDENIEIKKAQALYGLLKTLNFLKQIDFLKQYPIIGIDALLTVDQNHNYRYGINEINLTSPMGQTQLLLLQMAVKFSDLALEILVQQGFDIALQKYQILADFFKDQDNKIIQQAKEILLHSQHLQGLIAKETKKLLTNNFASETLENIQHFINQ